MFVDPLPARIGGALCMVLKIEGTVNAHEGYEGCEPGNFDIGEEEVTYVYAKFS